MSEHHKVPVVKITSIRPHGNAERLELIDIDGYQVVSGKGQFKVGDLAYYIAPDSIVPARSEYSFVWERDGGGNKRDIQLGQEIPERWRRITVKKLRGEWSEGLLMSTIEPYSDSLNGIDFYKPASFALLRDNGDIGNQIQVCEGDDVAEFLGVTHYNPPEDEAEESTPSTSKRQSRKRPASLKGWFFYSLRLIGQVLSFGLYKPWGVAGGKNENAPKNTPPVYDVEALKKFPDVFQPTDWVTVTEKIHGSNARYLFQDGRLYVGSRNLWKSPTSGCIWRRAAETIPGIEHLARACEGHTLYGEVVPTQKDFDYGATKDKPRFFLFDIRRSDGGWQEHVYTYNSANAAEVENVPVLYDGWYDPEAIKNTVDGQSKVAEANNIREGVVVKSENSRRVRGLGRLQLKIVSNKYYEKTK